MTAPAFVDARLDTALIERERGHLFAPRAETTPAMWNLVAQAFWRAQRGIGKATSALPKTSPWDDRGGWAPRRARRATFAIPRRRCRTGNPGTAGRWTNLRCTTSVVRRRRDPPVSRWRASPSSSGSIPINPPSKVRTPTGASKRRCPGRVLAVLVKVGDEVARGAPLVVLEAMKMEQIGYGAVRGQDRSRVMRRGRPGARGCRTASLRGR